MLHARTDSGNCVSLSQDQVRVVFAKKNVSSPCVTHDVARAFIFILLLAHERSTFDSLFLIFNLINLSGHVADQWTMCARSTEWGVWLCGQNNRFYGLWAHTWSTTSTTQRLFQRSSRMNPSTKTRNRRTRSMRNSTMSFSEKRYLHNYSLRSKKNQRTWDTLITLKKKVCYQLSPFHPNKNGGNPCTNQVQICLKNGNQVATWKTSKSGFSLKDTKSEFLLKSDLWDPEARTSSRVWQKKYPGTNWNYWFSANGYWSYSYRVWAIQARSKTTSGRKCPNKIGLFTKTCIRNMRDMEELQKKSRVKGRGTFKKKLTEDFEAGTSFFQGSSVKTVYNFVDNDARCWDLTTSTPGIRWLDHCTFRSEKASASLFAGLSHTKRKLVSTCTVNFLASTGNPVTGCHKKRKSNQEFDNCQDQGSLLER